jgi:hypothetical protein
MAAPSKLMGQRPSLTARFRATKPRDSREAGSGAVSNYGGRSLTFTNVTFSDNGISIAKDAAGGAISDFGFDNPATVNLKGTILATSRGGNCPNSGGGTINDNGYNIADDATCDLDTTPPTGTSQIITPSSDTGLASGLGTNGGPNLTIALNGTPVNTFIPAADCTDQSTPAQKLMTDQRGYGRPVAGTCSAGAYQHLGTPPIDCSKAAASNPNLVALLPV